MKMKFTAALYQFKMTLMLEKRIFQYLNLKYDKHCKKKSCRDID